MSKRNYFSVWQAAATGTIPRGIVFGILGKSLIAIDKLVLGDEQE